MNKKDWNPELYLKFNKERIQPSIDLVSRIEIENPKKIIDIGCGPGNSTQILRERWSHSHIVGIDKSESMISKAANDFPTQEWKLFDVETDEFQDKYDIVYSNATIQWIHNHDLLLKKLGKIVSTNGAIAIQIPLFFNMPLGQSISKIAQDSRWLNLTKDVDKLFTILNHFEYYDILSKNFVKVEMWETHYIHIMESHLSILEMIRSTGLKPYIDKLVTDDDKKQFDDMVFDSIKSDYSIQKNGKVLFPFNRLFFIGYK
jgi:trans-aconitate 2-methyltransferase